MTRWDGPAVAIRVDLRHGWVILTYQGECIPSFSHSSEVLIKVEKIFVMLLLDSSVDPYALSMTC